jgi:hypothetical protein
VCRQEPNQRPAHGAETSLKRGLTIRDCHADYGDDGAVVFGQSTTVPPTTVVHVVVDQAPSDHGFAVLLAVITGLLTLAGVLLAAWLALRFERRRAATDRSQASADLVARAMAPALMQLGMLDSMLLASTLQGMGDPTLLGPLRDWVMLNLGIESREVATITDKGLRERHADFFWSVNGFTFTNALPRPTSRVRYEARLLAHFGTEVRDALAAHARGESYAVPKLMTDTLNESLGHSDAVDDAVIEAVPKTKLTLVPGQVRAKGS